MTCTPSGNLLLLVLLPLACLTGLPAVQHCLGVGRVKLCLKSTAAQDNGNCNIPMSAQLSCMLC
jgi:hypothetical protein